MVRYEIYDEEKKEAEDKVIRLALEYGSDDRVHVVAVDEDGEIIERGHLVAFLPDGRIELPGYVSDDAGFELDKLGRIKQV